MRPIDGASWQLEVGACCVDSETCTLTDICQSDAFEVVSSDTAIGLVNGAIKPSTRCHRISEQRGCDACVHVITV
jgi:hypothetical protein